MNDRQNFTTGSVPKKLLGFMIPILFALIMQAMYSAVDLLIVGQFGTTEGISGVTTGSNIMNMVTFTISALTTGVTVVMGMYLGENKPEKLGRLIGSAVSFFLTVALVMTLLLLVFARQLAVIMQTPAEALELTVLYIRICAVGYVFIVFYNFISSIFRGLGDSKMPLVFVAIACVVNVIGDLVLVAGLHMNVAGAAIATVGAQAVSVLLSLYLICKKDLGFTITLKDIRFSSEIKRFLKVGLPLAFQDFLTNLTFLALCAFINKLGLDASSGYGIAQKIQSFIMLIPVAIMQSMSAVVAQNVGAGKEDRAKEAMFCGMGFGSAIGLVVGLLVFFRGDLTAALFTRDAAVILRAFEFLRGFAPEAVVTCILFSFMGYFNGHSQSLFVMIQGLAQSFLIRLPLSYIMSIQPDATLTGVGAAAPAATCFGILLCLLYYLHNNRKLAKSKRMLYD
ncbi:MAG: MATE family efflux transporter [Lachnospiraceae bacterium]|nr:MATE family efflux transporter [Lachnospiraceae bacterium]